MKNLTKDIKENEEPTLQNFFKFCQKYYGREVHCGEITFSSYYVGDHKKVKSNPALFCRLSEKYFKEMHNVENPIRDGKYGFKMFASTQWNFNEYGHSTKELDADTRNNNKEFNAIFDAAWNDIINDGNFYKMNKLRNGEYNAPK